MHRCSLLFALLFATLAGCETTSEHAHQQQTVPDDYVPGPVVTLHAWLGDQCSFAPDLDIGFCCYQHDLAYATGGDERDRFLADRDFKRCIQSAGRPLVAAIYFSGVRTFGWLFFEYR